MVSQSLPRSARAYQRAQSAETVAALAAVRRLWSRMGPEFDRSYAAIELPLLAVVYTAQGRVAAGARAYIPQVMAEVGFASVPEPEFETFPEAWVGTTGDGRSVAGLASFSVVRAKQSMLLGSTPAVALERAGRFLTSAVGGVLSDTARGVEKVEGNARRVSTYVRMLTPPSCGRCAILAGQTSGASVAFERHPRCDCRNVPAPENVAGDLTTDPGAYLESLSDEDLARTLGSKANAEAYREHGADVNQLVNAYRHRGDVRKAQVYGREVKYTIEGTTRRGWAHHRMAQADYLKVQGERKRGRGRALEAPRLMPESIFEIAKDREDAARLLKLYGWVV